MESYADIEPLEPAWTWPGHIPSDELTILAGDGGIGKGFLMADLVARITRGDTMADGSPGIPAASVIMITPEDNQNTAVAHRLRAAGAELSSVFDMTDDSFLLPNGATALREAIEETDARLVIIDPLSAVSSVALTSSNVTVRRKVMEPLERIARECGVAIVAVHHTVKSGRVAGSKGITDAARMVLRVTRSEVDQRIRLVHVEKCNVAPDDVPDIAYTVTGTWPGTRVEFREVPADVAAEQAGEVLPKAVSTADRIVRLLEGLGEPADPQGIARATGLTYGNVRVALHRLAEAGAVVSPSRGQWTVPGPEARALRVIESR